MQNLYLFTGENHYELRQELTRRKDNFAQKFGADSVFSYNSENREAVAIKQNLYGGGLFVSKKLIVLFGLPLDSESTNKLKEEQYSKLAEDIVIANHIPEDTILICVSYKPDKRARFYKRITKSGQIKEFGLHNTSGLKTFLKQQTADLNLSVEVISALIDKIGTDQFRLMSEVEKLRYRKSRNPSLDISLATVEDVTFGMTETNSFKFFDHLLTDPPASCKILDDIQHDGTDRNQTAGMLYRGLRNNLIILDFLRQGIDDSKTIASEAKMNPRQVSTLLKQQSTLLAKEHFIKNLFKKLIELECDIKTGKVPAEYFRLGVKELLLKNP